MAAFRGQMAALGGKMAAFPVHPMGRLFGSLNHSNLGLKGL